jgi:anti-anti-sigma factor
VALREAGTSPDMTAESTPATELVVFLRGEVDMCNVGGLRDILARESTCHRSGVVDMIDTTFIDASVLSVLAQAQGRFCEGLRVRNANPSIARVFGLVEMQHLLTDSAESAPED